MPDVSQQARRAMIGHAAGTNQPGRSLRQLQRPAAPKSPPPRHLRVRIPGRAKRSQVRRRFGGRWNRKGGRADVGRRIRWSGRQPTSPFSYAFNRRKMVDAMPRYCELTELATDKPIHINPIQIRFIRSAANNHTQIVFDADHSVGVIESLAVVRQALDDADRTERQQAQLRHDWRGGNAKPVI